MSAFVMRPVHVGLHAHYVLLVVTVMILDVSAGFIILRVQSEESNTIFLENLCPSRCVPGKLKWAESAAFLRQVFTLAMTVSTSPSLSFWMHFPTLLLISYSLLNSHPLLHTAVSSRGNP